MAQSLAKIYLHIVFGTKHCQNLIRPEIEKELYKYMAGILKNLDCRAIAIGGIANHVHILNMMSRTISISDMMCILKKDSSKWIKSKGDVYKNFHWQDGYGVFSVNQYGVERVKSYIENQHSHHRKKSFENEYRRFLDSYKIDYDEKYIWD
jgi:putative transposase